MLTDTQARVLYDKMLEHRADPALALNIAIGLMEGWFKAEKPTEERVERTEEQMRQRGFDPAWFREAENGQQKLSDEGLEFLFSLFDQGVRIGTAAKRLGISHGGAKHRHAQWERLVAAGLRPNARTEGMAA